MARVISLLGKGGTGRSTLTLAMAQAEARRGKKVLVISLEPLSAIGHYLDVNLSAEPQEVATNLWAVHFSTTNRLEGYWSKLRVAEEEFARISLFREVYGQEMGILPGFDQFLLLFALRDWDLNGNYDYLFFDGGSGLEHLRMFAVPEQGSWYVRRFGEAFSKSPIGQILSPFLEPIARSILTVNFSGDNVKQTTGKLTDILGEGKAVMESPDRLLLYLVTTEDPLAVATARRLWGASQLMGLSVGGILVRGTADLGEQFSSLPIRRVPEGTAAELSEKVEDLAGASPILPRTFVTDEQARTVSIHLPGFTKKQVELSQYGPELTIRAADQRRNFVLPYGLSGLRATGAKFANDYLTITLG